MTTRFCDKFNADGIPKAFPGCTLLGTPYPVGGHAARMLATIQGNATKILGPNFTPVPPGTFHVTEADLIAGVEPDQARLVQIADRLAEIFSEADLRRDATRPITASPARLTSFGEVLVAWVGIRPEDLKSLKRLRGRIYGDLGLQNLGVREPEFEFVPHVTIGHMTGSGEVGAELEARLGEVIETSDRLFDAQPSVFVIDGVSLFRFPHLHQYDERTVLFGGGRARLWEALGLGGTVAADYLRSGSDDRCYLNEVRYRTEINRARTTSDVDEYEDLLTRGREEAHRAFLDGGKIEFAFHPAYWDAEWEGSGPNTMNAELDVWRKGSRRTLMHRC
jgi:2'-5' RNA ligase